MNLLKRVLPFALALLIGAASVAIVHYFKQSSGSIKTVLPTANSGISRCSSAERKGKGIVETVGISDLFNGIEIYDGGRTEIDFMPVPRYTEAARRKRVSGTVQLILRLNADGTVSDIKSMTSLPYGLTKEAIATAKRIKFKPALSANCEPISIWATVNCVFSSESYE